MCSVKIMAVIPVSFDRWDVCSVHFVVGTFPTYEVRNNGT